jgi:hypothetical protein
LIYGDFGSLFHSSFPHPQISTKIRCTLCFTCMSLSAHFPLFCFVAELGNSILLKYPVFISSC